MSDSWLSIESAPRDGSQVVCWGPSFERVCILVWKTNSRIVMAHDAGANLDWQASYFGDADEDDDYYFAKDGGGPTIWVKLPPLPSC